MNHQTDTYKLSNGVGISDVRLIPLIGIWSAVSSLKEEQCHEYQRMEMVEQKQYY